MVTYKLAGPTGEERMTEIDPDPTPNSDDFLNEDDPLSNTGGGSGINLSNIVVPWPGSSFIIRCASSGKVITLLDGEITLAFPPTSSSSSVSSSIAWSCVEKKGWLGFYNKTSGRYLGHDKRGKLICSVQAQNEWENFCVRLRPQGAQGGFAGFALYMQHWKGLSQLEVTHERGGGIERLAKIGDSGADGIVWEFLRV